ncbi:hypothetical protein JW916_11995 [Candidatus Sumerlaeota bacterium]|nr:hypothetical protein [Candidatus Sumerlaeota bacterium]
MLGNDGDSPTPKFLLQFYRVDPEDRENLTRDEQGRPISGSHFAGPIQPGDRWNEVTGPFPLQDGDYEFAVVLDPENTVSERDETNNRAEMKVRIRKGQIVE